MKLFLLECYPAVPNQLYIIATSSMMSNGILDRGFAAGMPPSMHHPQLQQPINGYPPMYPHPAAPQPHMPYHPMPSSYAHRFAYYLHTICILFAYYLHTICILFAYYLHIICILFAYYLHIICILFTYYFHIICI